MKIGSSVPLLNRASALIAMELFVTEAEKVLGPFDEYTITVRRSIVKGDPFWVVEWTKVEYP